GAAGRNGRAADLAHRPRSDQRNLCGNRQTLAKAADRHRRVEADGVNRTPLQCITSSKPVHEEGDRKSAQFLIFSRRSARCTEKPSFCRSSIVSFGPNCEEI